MKDRLFKAMLAIGSAGLTLVLGAQVWYALPEGTRRAVVPASAMNLHPYQMVDDRCPTHWKLRPDYDGPNVMVGSRGFKNDPVGLVSPAVLAVGDSCTFGIGGGYPMALQSRLGVPVVNGGVEGYSARNVLCRMPDYLATGPQFAIVYIGWNDLFGEFPEPSKVGLARLLETSAHHARQRWGHRTKYWRPQDSPQYTPSFLGVVEDIVVGFQDQGVRTLVVTLPGLYRTALKPSAAALERGHLPVWTDNAYVLAYHTEVYNKALRALAARLGAGVLDAAVEFPYSEDDYMDSVHLYEEAQTRLGEWMAGRLR